MMDGIAPRGKISLSRPALHQDGLQSDEWMPVRPGTDLAFLLAMINVIATKNLETVNLLKSLPSVVINYPPTELSITPEWAGKLRIPADTIRRIAREFAAANRNALAHPGWRTSNFINSFHTERAIAILNAMVGNVFGA